MVTEVTILDEDITVYAVWRFSTIVVDANYSYDGSEVEVDVNLPDDEYYVEVDEEENVIIVRIEEGEVEDVTVNPPSEYWSYTVVPDGQGGVIVTLIPPPDAGYEIEIGDGPEYPIVIYVTVSFVAGNGGTLGGPTESHQARVRRATVITAGQVPTAIASINHTFTGWSPSNPVDHTALVAITFTANFNFNPPPQQPPRIPWDPGTPYRPPVFEIEVLGYAEFFNERFVRGYPDGTFRPRNAITRAEATALLVRTMIDEFSYDAQVPSLDGVFSDVDSGSWYRKYVAWAYNHGLVKGYPDGTFQPNSPITREEFAAIVARGTTVVVGDAPFADAADVSYWAQNYVNSAFHAGWVVGDEHGRFVPAADITRAEATAIISRMIDRNITTTESFENVIEDVRFFSDVTNSSTWFYYYVVDGSNSYWFNALEDAKVWTQVVQYND